MIYEDLIHGKVTIEEPVILDIIGCKAIQRLKGIDQAGYSEPYFPNTKHNRFEHSVGDYLLLKKYGASLEEQINGLIHDVSHSAFSHCIDYVLDGGSQESHDYQDNIFHEFVLRTEIPAILERYGLDTKKVIDEKNYPLQEKDLPDLCADRIDYSLRTAMIFEEATRKDIEEILSGLFVSENRWLFRNQIVARKYADIFLAMNNKYYSGFTSANMFLTVGDYLRHALSSGYISENDLYLTDKELLEKVRIFHDKDEKLRLFFDRMDRKIVAREDDNGYKVSCKSRVVDPSFVNGDTVCKLSDRDDDWKILYQKYSTPKEYHISFAE
jgi:HD superfamily phosphohydrolase